jgi:hypothetical protein
MIVPQPVPELGHATRIRRTPIMMGLGMYVITAIITAIHSRRMQMVMASVMSVTQRRGVEDVPA